MEKPPPEKSGSFSGHNVASHPPESEAQGEIEERENAEDSSSISNSALPQVSQDIDGFLSHLALHDDKSNPPDVPDSVEVFCKLVEAMIGNYDSGDSSARFGQVPEDDTTFVESAVRISKLMNALRGFPVESPAGAMYGRSGSVLQRAMSFLEDEIRTLLEDSRNHISDSKSLKTKHPSFNSKEDHHDRCSLPESESTGDDDYPAYPPDVVASMKKVATAMISAGYETECCQVFSILRRNAFKEAINKLGFDSISIDDVQKMQWETLEGEIATWIKVVKHCSLILFPGERRFAESVFEDYPAIFSSQFSNLARAAVIHFLNFAEAVAMTKRSAEKLFKFLDMYETLRDLVPAISSPTSDDNGHELKSETMTAGSRLGEAAVSIFCDLENSIKSDVSKTPVPSGSIHPLTSYTMNYLKYACEYKDTLEEVFRQHQKIEHTDEAGSDAENERSSQNNARPPVRQTPFATQLIAVMDLLDSNLETKSKLYKDMSLRYIFLMNNGRYILQKIKASSEIHEVMGDTWCRRRSSDLRQYHNNYKRETWSKVLHCLKDEGLQVNGKVNKPVLKERFKTFNTLFDEIHKTQSTWVVKDEQLRSELRVSISAVMIPAYRSFLARFSQYLDAGRQTEKYIKYQPDDIETSIDELFDGNPTSMARKRT